MLDFFYVININYKLPYNMKKHAEDEKLQSAEGARFGNGKQGQEETQQ